MTVEVKITKPVGQCEDFVVKVATVSVDPEGNESTQMSIVELKEGVEESFMMHSNQELRVYETDRPKEG